MAIKKFFSNFSQRNKEKIVVGFFCGAYLGLLILLFETETFGKFVFSLGFLGVAFFLTGMYVEKNRERQYDSGIFTLFLLAGVVLSFVFFKIGASVEKGEEPFSGVFSLTFVYIYLMFMFIAFKAGKYHGTNLENEVHINIWNFLKKLFPKKVEKSTDEGEESESSIWLCNDCGSQIEAEVYYCPKCGKYLRGFGKKTKKSQ